MFWDPASPWFTPVITSLGTLALLTLKTWLETYLQRRARQRDFDLKVADELAALVSKVAEDAGSYWHEGDGPELRRTEQKIIGALHRISASLELCRASSSHFASEDFDEDLRLFRAVIQRDGFETKGRPPDHARASEIVRVGEGLRSRILRTRRKTL